MHIDFADAAKMARASIEVPPVPIEAIRTQVRDGETRARRRGYLAAAVCVALLGAGAATGKRIYDGVHLWLSGSKIAVTVTSLAIVREPMASDVRSVASRATFPVVFPVGVPSDAHVGMIQFAPAEHPNSVTVDYRSARGFDVGFSLFDSSTVSSPGGGAPPKSMPGDAYVWHVGGETVVAPKSHISALDADRIKAQMLATTPSQSIERTLPLLVTLSIQGNGADYAAVARRYAPTDGLAVLLGSDAARQVLAYAAKGRPFLDMRTVYLSDIPSENGEPDYSKARLSWPSVPVISARGVRAIAAVVERHPCACAILFYPHDRSAYRIWEIASPASTSAKLFVVDASTMAVTQAR